MLVLAKVSWSPNKSDNFAAYVHSAGFFVCYNTFVCGNDSNAKSAKYFWQFVFASIYTKTRFGNSLDSADGLLVFIYTIFQGNFDSFCYSIFNDFVALNISFI